MPDFGALDRLLFVWRQYLTDNPGRDDPYVRGLAVCADQLAETIERMRADA